VSTISDCVFCKIVAAQIPASIVHRDEQLVAFEDISPQAPMHVLIVPVEHVASTNALSDEHDALIGRAMRLAATLARQRGYSESGYRIVVNTGSDGGQTVNHLHIHVLGGRQFSWPPG